VTERRGVFIVGAKAVTVVSIVCFLLASAASAVTGSEDRTVSCRVVSVVADGFHVDAGAAAGLAAGDVGLVEGRGEGQEIRVEVVQTASRTALLRIVSRSGVASPVPGDRVTIRSKTPGSEAETSTPEPVGTAAPGKQTDEPFVPLLAPTPRAAQPQPTANIFHGRLSVRQLFQTDPENGLDYSRTRVGSDGSVERLGGTPWSLEWSGDVYYRKGSGYSGFGEDGEVRLDVLRLFAERRFEDGSFFRFGRILPRELPSIGYIDGVEGETPIASWLHLGAIAGMKPVRRNLDPSFDEPTGAVYGTVETGTRGSFYYSGSLGLLGSLYDGHYDRTAVLWDQRLELTPKFSLYSTSELDLHTGAAGQNDGPQLTHFDAYAVSPVTTFLTLRAGLDHWERPDTRSEENVLPFPDARLYDRGYWRYFVGGSENLPWNLRVDEEIAWIDAPDSDYAARWQVGVTRTGLLALTRAQVGALVYNLDGADAAGYGGRAWAWFPLFEDALSLRPALGFRWVETDATAERFRLTDISVDADWWISRAWRAFAGVSWTLGDSIESTDVELGLDFRW
jgi:hypothetical protein